jgi:hypothetical protein
MNTIITIIKIEEAISKPKVHISLNLIFLNWKKNNIFFLLVVVDHLI